jgi:biotin synthase
MHAATSAADTFEPTDRHDWSRAEIEALFALPFADLIFRAQTVHRRHFDPNAIQASTLLNIKTGGCPEDCGYCAQSSRYETGVGRERLLGLDEVAAAAAAAKANGASRFCMGAAWRNLADRHIEPMAAMIRAVKGLGLETCMTLGMLSAPQAKALKAAGLDFYNHNVDTSPEYYSSVVTTRTYQDRLDTLAEVQAAGMKVCSGGIVGMGESRADRAGMLLTLANLTPHPESVPINMLVPIPGTPLGHVQPIDGIEFVRTVAAARILMPRAVVRLSAGRETMSEELQALCFLAGANSAFVGDKLLTVPNVAPSADAGLFARLGLTLWPAPSSALDAAE